MTLLHAHGGQEKEKLGCGQWAWWVLWEGAKIPTSSTQVQCHWTELSGHQQEPVGDGGLGHEVPVASTSPARHRQVIRKRLRPAGGYKHKRLHHSGGVMVWHVARNPSSRRRFMDHLTFPACSLFITSTCNDELKILLHEAHSYCLMELPKEASG